MRFKYRKSMKLPYRKQGYIFFRCQLANSLPEEEREKIKKACDSTGFGDAVYEYITTDASSIYICQKHYISEKWLAVKTAEVFRLLDKEI